MTAKKVTSEAGSETPKSAPQAKKPSIREEIKTKEEGVVKQTEDLITSLHEMEAFAKKNNRPHRHLFVYQRTLSTFINQFKRSQR